ncbi:hypothetical protein HDZ31DRAFT_76515 [Schizophyllum fasciatum]
MSASRTSRRSAAVRDSAAPYSPKRASLPRTIETRSRTIASAPRSVAVAATPAEPAPCAKPHSRKDSLASCKASLKAREASLASCQASLVAALAEVEAHAGDKSLKAKQCQNEKREEDATACDLCYTPMFKPRIWANRRGNLLICPTCRRPIKVDRVPPVCFQVKAHVDAWAMANDVAASHVGDSAFVWPPEPLPEPLPVLVEAVSDSEDGTSEPGAWLKSNKTWKEECYTGIYAAAASGIGNNNVHCASATRWDDEAVSALHVMDCMRKRSLDGPRALRLSMRATTTMTIRHKDANEHQFDGRLHRDSLREVDGGVREREAREGLGKGPKGEKRSK